MRDASPGTIFLKDYAPPDYLIEKTELHFELGEEFTLVHSVLHMRRNSQVADDTALRLHGQDLELLSVAIDEGALDSSDYQVNADSLVIGNVPSQFELKCTTRIFPQNNSSLEGLYKSRTMYCTQCEAEGFRKITYYLDRPDVMSVFTVAIDADPERYPVLLSNGNLQAIQTLNNGLQRAVWYDPFPKPAYLFALVAGELEFIQDTFTTCSGRDVTLRIYVEEKDLDKCDHAMLSLKQSMRWDEEVYGREYDLDIFNIVAVDDFNMGAMENKSLNIFNTSCVLCSPDITTDAGFQRVQAIVAHEYFHNWSGNRVTCRDWFQLSLKEGFTVYRDSQFSADMTSRTVKRVEDVTLLRTAQFAEDAGPMAHPIRPDSYMEINNFYTLTVYEKGAEVVRMIHTLLGPQAFRRGSDLYFERHDGQAATCEDFVVAMEEASGRDLGQFRNWYSQAGTPQLTVSDEWDESSRTYSLTVEQSCGPTPGQQDKAPFVIPLAMGLLGDAGALPLKLKGEELSHDSSDNTHRVLTIDKPAQTFEFEGLPERPVPSLLRGFSAPVRLNYDYSNAALRALMSRDDDGFVRWDSAQALAAKSIGAIQLAQNTGGEVQLEPLLEQACEDLLLDESLDPAMVAAMLRLPAENTLAELASHMGGADVDGIHAAREFTKSALGLKLAGALELRYHQLENTQAYSPDAKQVARRSLRNVCLEYLVAADPAKVELASSQFSTADNMTDRLCALNVLANYGDEVIRTTALDSFHSDWRHEGLVVNQWLQVQAAIADDDALARVQALMDHPDFDIRNPNKVRSLIGVFSTQNPVNFHRIDGEGYRFLADVVLQLNASNPQIAARLLGPLTKWRMYLGRQEMMKAQLQRLAESGDLSPDVYEVVQKSLAS